MKLVVLDLEWNTAYFTKKQGFANEIIEFGAVMLNDALEEIDSFSTLVRPGNKHTLRSSVKKITNLSNEELRENGIPFTKALKMFADWSKDCIIGSWSKSDIYALIENCRIFCAQDTVPFLEKYIDLQEYVQRRMVPRVKNQISLQDAAVHFGIDVDEGEMHRARTDSRVTASILRRCYDADRFSAMVSECDEGFYEKLFFKPYIIKDMRCKEIDERDFAFSCEKCGERLRQKNHWQFKDKYFNAKLFCRKCNISYNGRVQVKKTYDNVLVKKTLRACVSSVSSEQPKTPVTLEKVKAVQVIH